jgi:hypothetical protein
VLKRTFILAKARAHSWPANIEYGPPEFASGLFDLQHSGYVQRVAQLLQKVG